MQDRYYARLQDIKDAMQASLEAQSRRDRSADNHWFSDLAGRTFWASDIPADPDAEQERWTRAPTQALGADSRLRAHSHEHRPTTQSTNVDKGRRRET